MKKLTMIVPCFNEEKMITMFYSEFCKCMDSSKYKWDLLFVDDGSVDATLKRIKELAEVHNNVLYLSLSRNFGKEAAMLAGMANASGDYIGVMDVDLQDPPELINQMIDILDEGEYDCVAAKRINRKGESIIKSFLSKMFYWLINMISDTHIESGARDYRLMTSQVAKSILAIGEYHRFSKGIFSWVGYKTYWLSYQNEKRLDGDSKWSVKQLFQYALEGIYNYSNAPLKLVSNLGLVTTIVAILALFVIVVRKILFGDPVTGWASTNCIIIFIGGLQLFCLGIIGQYVAKTYMETKKRPHFIVRETNKTDCVDIK